jgi:hypothetical protein
MFASGHRFKEFELSPLELPVTMFLCIFTLYQQLELP